MEEISINLAAAFETTENYFISFHKHVFKLSRKLHNSNCCCVIALHVSEQVLITLVLTFTTYPQQLMKLDLPKVFQHQWVVEHCIQISNIYFDRC